MKILTIISDAAPLDQHPQKTLNYEWNHVTRTTHSEYTCSDTRLKYFNNGRLCSLILDSSQGISHYRSGLLRRVKSKLLRESGLPIQRTNPSVRLVRPTLWKLPFNFNRNVTYYYTKSWNKRNSKRNRDFPYTKSHSFSIAHNFFKKR